MPNRYEGYFKNKVYEGKGKGIYYHRNDFRYEGEFKEGKIEGKGICYFKCGIKKCEGEIKY